MQINLINSTGGDIEIDEKSLERKVTYTPGKCHSVSVRRVGAWSLGKGRESNDVRSWRTRSLPKTILWQGISNFDFVQGRICAVSLFSASQSELSWLASEVTRRTIRVKTFTKLLNSSTFLCSVSEMGLRDMIDMIWVKKAKLVAVFITAHHN